MLVDGGREKQPVVPSLGRTAIGLSLMFHSAFTVVSLYATIKESACMFAIWLATAPTGRVMRKHSFTTRFFDSPSYFPGVVYFIA